MMKMSVIVLAMAACAAPAFAGVCCGVYHPGTASSRDRLLATPAPYPANRVDSPSRAENGRLWVPDGSYAGGATRYGADRYSSPRVIYARRDHQVIAISPWCDLRGDSRVGFDDLERARNQWLREQGYVLKVRTHVNPRTFAAEQMASGGLPTPRATIRRTIETRTPESPVAFTGSVTTDEIRARIAAEAALADAE